MSMQKILILMLASASLLAQVYAQKAPQPDTVRGFYMGMLVGMYKPNNADAAYYGRQQLQMSQNEQEAWNRSNIERIENAIGARPLFDMDGNLVMDFPYYVRYSPAVLIGFFVAYQLANNFSITGSYNFSQQTAGTDFKLMVEPTSNRLVSEDFVKGSVQTKENRSLIEIGFNQTLIRPDKWKPFLEGGLGLLIVEQKEPRMSIANMSIQARVDEDPLSDGRNVAVGAGFYANAGVALPLKGQYSAAAGAGGSFYQARFYGDKAPIRASLAVFLRLIRK
jgi:hypothetical protein